MARQQTDSYEFLITPKLDTSNIDNGARDLEKAMEDVSKNIVDKMSSTLGKGFQLPSGFQPSDIDQVTKVIESLGGTVKRVGTTISASFKDANGDVIQLNQSIAETVEKLQQTAGTAKNKQMIEAFKQSSAVYTSSQQSQEEAQLEQQIIKSLQEQYNYKTKIIDAQNSGNRIQEEYYTQLLNTAKGEEQIYTIQYTGSQNNIKAKKQELAQEEQLYQKKSDAVKQENELVNAIKQYAKQYQTVKQLESKGQQNTQAYTNAKNALQQLTTTISQYGVQVVTSSDGTTKLVAKQNSMADSSNKVKTALDNANGSLVKTDTAQNSLSQSIQSSVENFIKYRVAMQAIYKITSEFTSAIYDMNEGMTQVRMVTMGSYEDTVALADSYTKLAKQLGTTTTTVAEGADAWLRQGYSAQDAMEMLKQSTTLAVVGQLGAQESTNQLTA